MRRRSRFRQSVRPQTKPDRPAKAPVDKKGNNDDPKIGNYPKPIHCTVCCDHFCVIDYLRVVRSRAKQRISNYDIDCGSLCGYFPFYSRHSNPGRVSEKDHSIIPGLDTCFCCRGRTMDMYPKNNRQSIGTRYD